jgi:transposase
MAGWATPPLDRRQIVLFSPTLDDSIAADHPVRLLEEMLDQMDFSAWEFHYVLMVGQPPIHPRVLAGGILYGLSLGIRSSRRLEDAAANRFDFKWLLEGRVPDHSTWCTFRTQFGEALKQLFKQVGRVGIEMGLVSFNQITLDGTSIRANNSRFRTGRRASLEQKVAALEEQIEHAFEQLAQQDQREEDLYGADQSARKLPAELADLRRRQAKLKETMRQLSKLEAARAQRKDRCAGSPPGPAIPLTDPDSRILPNKAGGQAPNYTAVLAVDSGSGLIVDTQVLSGNDEASTVLPAVARVQENFGVKPEQVAADSGFNTGKNLAALDQQGVEALMPAKQTFAENPAVRGEPTQAVAAEQREALPLNPQRKVLDKAAFIYDAPADNYHCPMGRTLSYVGHNAYDHHGNKGLYRIYECMSCAGCPLGTKCLPRNAVARRLCRDEYESLREQMAQRMNRAPGRDQYRRRAPTAETPFAVLKTRMNFRQFLLRGSKKVEQEWRWVATAYNLVKLMAHRVRLGLAPSSKAVIAMA